MAKKNKPAPKSKSKSATRKRPAERKQATKLPKAKLFQRCGEACPLNVGSGGSHRGACYLDVGHTSSHKCSVDGFEWT
jgi:hypothetical protein